MASLDFVRYIEARGRPRVVLAILFVVILVLAASVTYLLDLGSHLEPLGDDTGRHSLTFTLMGVLLGVAVSLLFKDVIFQYLEEPNLRNLPRRFRKAAYRELLNPGYYRFNNRFAMHLSESGLRFSTSSTIVSTRKNAIMKPPKVAPPGKLCLYDMKYSHNGEDVRYFEDKEGAMENQFIRLPKWTKEDLEVVYRFEHGRILDTLEIEDRKFRDEHRWTSPVADFELTARIPKGFRIAVFVLDGLGEQIIPEVTPQVDGVHRFVQRKAAFSFQGFRWRIAPEDSNRCQDDEPEDRTGT